MIAGGLKYEMVGLQSRLDLDCGFGAGLETFGFRVLKKLRGGLEMAGSGYGLELAECGQARIQGGALGAEAPPPLSSRYYVIA